MILVIECGLAVALVCRLFGHCRQAFYQSKADIESEVAHERRVIEAVRAIRDEDPGIGGYKVIERYIHFYNYRRPHMSIGYKVPAVVHLERGEQKRMWKNKIYPKKDSTNENNVVSLPSRANCPGSACPA